MQNDDLPWSIINTYFKDNTHALVKHHLDSYNDFFNNGIQQIFKENCELVEMLKKSMLENKDIVETYIITMCLIVNTYKLGIHLKIDEIGRAHV